MESPVIGNGHAGFGRGTLEKDRKAPRSRPTSAILDPEWGHITTLVSSVLHKCPQCHPYTLGTDAFQRVHVGPDELRGLGKVSEHRTVLDERRRVAALLPRGGHECVPARIDDLDWLTLLVDAFGVPRPARHDCGALPHRTAEFQLRRYHGEEELRDALRCVGADAGQRVPDLRVGEALDDGAAVGARVDSADGPERRYR